MTTYVIKLLNKVLPKFDANIINDRFKSLKQSIKFADAAILNNMKDDIIIENNNEYDNEQDILVLSHNEISNMNNMIYNKVRKIYEPLNLLNLEEVEINIKNTEVESKQIKDNNIIEPLNTGKFLDVLSTPNHAKSITISENAYNDSMYDPPKANIQNLNTALFPIYENLMSDRIEKEQTSEEERNKKSNNNILEYVDFFLLKIKNLCDTSSQMISWVEQSYNWIQERFLKSFIKNYKKQKNKKTGLK
jgi:hypothetical protein